MTKHQRQRLNNNSKRLSNKRSFILKSQHHTPGELKSLSHQGMYIISSQLHICTKHELHYTASRELLNNSQTGGVVRVSKTTSKRTGALTPQSSQRRHRANEDRGLWGQAVCGPAALKPPHLPRHLQKECKLPKVHGFRPDLGWKHTPHFIMPHKHRGSCSPKR